MARPAVDHDNDLMRRRYATGLLIGLLGCDLDSEVVDDPSDHNNDTDAFPDTVCIGPLDAIPAPTLELCEQPRADYQPSATDSVWPACITDDGAYHLIGATPSSIARVMAYEDLLPLLNDGAFTEARVLYAQDEGLESRLQRREDLRAPAIPVDAHDPGVDTDKQCTVADNTQQYPDRCAGPALIAPLINQAFQASESGGQDLAYAAQIDAALLWFFTLSVYKEANTCFTSKAADCDSSWAYYGGGQDVSGGLGLAARVKDVSIDAHNAIWSAILAFRCLRDLYPGEDPMLDDAGSDLLFAAQTQLAAALDFGVAQVVRSRLVEQQNLCGAEGVANWAFLQVLGPTLDREGQLRDADAYAPLLELWSTDVPTAEQVEAGLVALDLLFPCPSSA